MWVIFGDENIMKKYMAMILSLATIGFYSEMVYCGTYDRTVSITVESCAICTQFCTAHQGTVDDCYVVKSSTPPTEGSTIVMSTSPSRYCNGTSCTKTVDVTASSGGAYYCSCKTPDFAY